VVRRPTGLELMLCGTIVLWALNFSVTRYVLTHGFQPLAYVAVRYGAAAAAFLAIALVREGTIRVSGRDVVLVLAAGVALYANQVAFVYAVKTTSASLVALILAGNPIFAALIGLAVGTERLSARFWAGALVSVGGVVLVVLGSGGALRGSSVGVLLGLLTSITWVTYSLLITPLMRSYSPTRISAVVLPAAWLPMALTGWPQVQSQPLHLKATVWLLVLFATVGPLILTNFLWFRSLDRVGTARATLATNIQPFIAALFAVALLSERLTEIQLVGGLLLAAGIFVARRRTPLIPPE
jgi:drug/metabolite transporter (DMT)-like permease